MNKKNKKKAKNGRKTVISPCRARFLKITDKPFFAGILGRAQQYMDETLIFFPCPNNRQDGSKAYSMMEIGQRIVKIGATLTK